MAAYDLADVDWFFGREQESAECLGIVDATGFVAIVGASGSGKSSLARAGVAPALRRDGRDVAVLNPGATPDRLLAGIDKGSVLVVDQLEELFVLCDDPAARARFAAGVCRWAATAPVVVTLRADHLGEVTELPELAARVQAGIYLLGAMGEPQLRAAIEGPAAKAGLRLEPGLVDLLVRDVAGEPGALPLLSHALAETYERREGPVLTTAGYRAVGGVHGAVARAADEVVDSLPPEGRKAARDLFMRLVIPTEISDPIRQRVPRADLAIDPTTAGVLDALVASRLVIADQDTVEVAHEAVCRAWPRLRAWLDEDRDGLRLHRHLAQASREWEQSGRDPSELYRGPRLVAALDWTRRDDIDLNESERAFLAASTPAEMPSNSTARRRIRRLRAALVGVAVLLAAGVGRRTSRHAQRPRGPQPARHRPRRPAGGTGSARYRPRRAARRTGPARRRPGCPTGRPPRRIDQPVGGVAVDESGSRRIARCRGLPAPSRCRRLVGAAGDVHRDTRLRRVPVRPGRALRHRRPVPGTSSAVVAVDGHDLMLLDLERGELEARFPPAPEGVRTFSGVRVSADGRFVAQLVQTSAAPTTTVLTVYEVATGRAVLGPLDPAVQPRRPGPERRRVAASPSPAEPPATSPSTASSTVSLSARCPA